MKRPSMMIAEDGVERPKMARRTRRGRGFDEVLLRPVAGERMMGWAGGI
jgi:hypothetical protein